MAKYKYKISEQEKDIKKPKDLSPAYLKRIEDLYGPIDSRDFFSADMDTYFKYKDTESKEKGGGVTHTVIRLASIEESLRKLTDTYAALKDLLKADEAKNDQNIQEVARDIKQALNKYRAHLRKFYPEQYKLALARINEEEVEEMSTSAGAGSYLTKYAFKKPKKQKELPEGTCGYDTDAKSGKKLKSPGGLEENIAATLGPGPKAGPDGVKDNYYIKKFKYKLVPKDKNGNYVQKGSGLEVKNF